MGNQFLDLTDAECVRLGHMIEAPSSSAWDLPSRPEALLHRIHSYPAKFPAFLASNALSYARDQDLDVRRVGDVFCGCGTVPSEARHYGLEFWGCDVNPVATLIARTKSAFLNHDQFTRLAREILSHAPMESTTPPISFESINRLSRWFDPIVFGQLAQVLNAIQRLTSEESVYRDALSCAFSAILKPCSKWKSRAIKPTLDPDKPLANVFKVFEGQVTLMGRAFSERPTKPAAKPDIQRANVLTIEPPSVPLDLIITSPPYVTSYEYADLHQLSALWLGYTDDHRKLREGSIGSSSHALDVRLTYRELNEIGVRIVFSLLGRGHRSALAVAKYLLDMQIVARRCKEFLSKRGIAVFVIGNTRLRDVEIDNASHLAESLLRAGFSKVRATRRRISNKAATPYRDMTGRFSQTRTSHSIYAQEYILVAHL